jgi:hypothetical protein
MREGPPKNALGTVVDRDAVAGAEGAHVSLSIVVLPRWAELGATVTVVAKERVVCARCDGGGCDGCEKSGAVRLPREAEARTFTLVLPAKMAAPSAVRVPRPFGDASPVALAVCVVRLGDAAAGCALVSPEAAPEGPPRSLVRALPVVAVVVALVAALVAWGR